MPTSRPRLPRVFRPTECNLLRLASALRSGAIVGVPSETVYGLAANALSADACAGIFEAKGRPTTDPLIVHLASAGDLSRVAHVNALALSLAAAFWPGPLTLVLPKKEHVPDIVTAGKATVAVRVPAHPVFRKLIKLAGCPLAAPSANPFGYVSPTTADHVREGLTGTSLRYVLDGGECRVGVESTIIDLVNPTRPRLLRPGGLPVEMVERVLGCELIRPRRTRLSAKTAAPAPGMLARHYSPRTPIILHGRLDAETLAKLPMTDAALLLRRPANSAADPRFFWLTDDGRLETAARNLFSVLRRLDNGAWTRIHAEIPAGAEGLAPAIRDRLTRAAAR